jgi:hypothetical protein
MKIVDVRSLPITPDENTITDLENMIRWGQLPSSMSDRVGADELDQYFAEMPYMDRFAQFAGNEQLIALSGEEGVA